MAGSRHFLCLGYQCPSERFVPSCCGLLPFAPLCLVLFPFVPRRLAVLWRCFGGARASPAPTPGPLPPIAAPRQRFPCFFPCSAHPRRAENRAGIGFLVSRRCRFPCFSLVLQGKFTLRLVMSFRKENPTLSPETQPFPRKAAAFEEVGEGATRARNGTPRQCPLFSLLRRPRSAGGVAAPRPLPPRVAHPATVPGVLPLAGSLPAQRKAPAGERAGA